jgi:hypothetical protein
MTTATYPGAMGWWVFVKDSNDIGHWLNLALVESVSLYYDPGGRDIPSELKGAIVQWSGSNRIHLHGAAAHKVAEELQSMKRKHPA